MRTSLTAAGLATIVAVVALGGPRVRAQEPTPAVRWFVIIDDLHLRFRDTGRVRGALRRLAEQAAGRGDSVAWTSTGPSGLQSPVTPEPTRHVEAIARMSGNGLHPGDVIRSLVDADMRPIQEPFHRATLTLAAVCGWLRSMSGEAGPQVLVVVSEGWPVAGDPGVAPALAPHLRRAESARDAIGARMAEAVAAAVTARIPVLAFDPREPAAAAAIEPGVDAAAQVALRALQLDSLRELTAASNGIVAEGPAALAPAMATLRAALSR